MRIARARFGNPIRPQTSFGDVWTTTWADDDALYSVSDDTMGFDNSLAPEGSNVAIHRLTGDAPQVRGLTINPMSQLGSFSQVYPEDDATWKANGLACIDGVLYLSISRHSKPRRRPFFIQETWDASILASHDHGLTWSAAPAIGRAMFPGKTFSTPFFVDYGKDGRGEADGADRYVYAVSSNGVWNNGSSMVLGRVERSALARLDSADWEFVHGFGDAGLPVWRTRHDTARYIFRAPGRTSMTGMTYIDPLGLYIMPQWHYPLLPDQERGWMVTRFEFYQSPAPWGPWTLFHSQEFEPESWYNPCLPTKFISDDGRRLWMFVAGDFTEAEKQPYYGLHLVEISLDVENT